MKMNITATNYHGETATFAVGQAVEHVTDEGAIFAGTIREIVGEDCLEILFEDGSDGTEKINTCY